MGTNDAATILGLKTGDVQPLYEEKKNNSKIIGIHFNEDILELVFKDVTKI